ncbi:MAG: hypothetical protein VKQ33_00120, partial [Candidatus Sericytochromatia bacterium]|nr:hypothetical protein [Candidatus Sericytochromatia bacterium]
MPHPWLIASPATTLPASESLDAAWHRGEPALVLHADHGPAGASWEGLGFGLPGQPPSLYVEAEPVGGGADWLAQAELARWRRALTALPASPGRREGRRRRAAPPGRRANHQQPPPPT